MKAVRIYGQGDVRVEDIAIDEPKPDQVQIKVKACGICGSDLHAYTSGWGLPTHPHPLTGKMVPVTFGHEFSGEVVKVGSAVTDLKIGDPVAVEPLFACGKCPACREGNYNFCYKVQADDGAGNFLGFSDDGGMAEYANIDDVFAHKLPEGMDYELGALCEPVSVVYEAIKRSGLREGNTVAIMGAGPIGLLAAVLARIAGANEVYISDVAEVRLAKARELGFTDVLNPAKQDVKAEIQKKCPNGVDIAFECAGVQATFDTALSVTKRTGKLQLVALSKPLTVNFTDDVIMQGIDITTTLAYENSFPTVIGIINAHQDQFKPVITKRVGLDDAIEGVKALASDKEQVKIMIEPGL
ncbi:2,3-butanediol dehydrogenase [Bifidobacterium sp. ESL0769]|uniref:2,3-butanediol dehydrogenase n=1 Tax=Bifidobacterium sp. ESL0769 TaxID=2983229 RepID=UPI0023FA3FFB|nr:2,3-butanediol dehydrogenase [Bifidobacterium sp. ESL0769]WEV67294.1 2,3-butanediol dehydrogenase [Bifidobacterium sp. ESL0769]